MLRFNAIHMFVIIALFAACGTRETGAHLSTTAARSSSHFATTPPPFSEPIELPPKLTSDEKEARIKAMVNEFANYVGEQCEKQNQDLKGSRIKGCPDKNYCLESIVYTDKGRSLNLSVSVSNTWGGYTIFAFVEWNFAPQTTSTGFCYHPMLMPVTQEFERSLRTVFAAK